jgi:hypothetical protein
VLGRAGDLELDLDRLDRLCVRTLTLAPCSDGSTRFTMGEEYTGPLLPLIWRSMPDLGPSFRQLADGLKQRAES